MTATIKLALAGATGQIGGAFLEHLAQAALPLDELHLLASAASSGKRIEYDGHYHTLTDLADFDFAQADIVVFATPPAVSSQYVAKSVEAGCKVLDFSGHYLTDMSAAIVCPGAVVPDSASIYVLPGAVATQLASLLLSPVAAGLLAAVDVTALFPASIAGRRGVDELASQSAALLNVKEPTADVFPERLAFQLLSAGSTAQGSSQVALEQGAVLALKRLFGLELAVSCQAFFLPVFHGTTLDVTLTFNDAVDQGRVEEWVEEAGINVIEVPENNLARKTLPETGRAGIHASINHNVARQSQKIRLSIAADNVYFNAFMGVQSLSILIKHHLY